MTFGRVLDTRCWGFLASGVDGFFAGGIIVVEALLSRLVRLRSWI